MQTIKLVIALVALCIPMFCAANPTTCYQEKIVITDRFSGEKDEFFSSLKLHRVNEQGFDFRLMQYARNYGRCVLKGQATRTEAGVFVYRAGGTPGNPVSVHSLIADPPCTITLTFNNNAVQYSGSAQCNKLCGKRFHDPIVGSFTVANRCAEVGR